MLIGMRINVIGGGLGGLAAALALARRGASVTVLEQAPSIGEVGAGIQISPNGLRVLEALGLGEALDATSVQARVICLRNGETGREVAKLDLRLLPETQRYLFVHRADLIDLLFKACEQAGVAIKLGCRIASVSDDATVAADDGTQFEADLTIGADGLHSVLRPVLNEASIPFFTGQVAWRATVPNRGGHPAHVRVQMGSGRHVVTYPLRDGDLVNLVAVMEREDWADEGWHIEDDPRAMESAFADFGPEVHFLMQSVERCHLWGLFRHPVAQRWHDGAGRLALLGDAAHPTLPFLAQGANMAFEDAWVLAEALSTHDTPQAALVAYQNARRDRVERVIEAANGNAWKYHLRPGPLRLAAHAGLRIASTVAPKKLLGQFDWLYNFDVTRGG